VGNGENWWQMVGICGKLLVFVDTFPDAPDNLKFLFIFEKIQKSIIMMTITKQNKENESLFFVACRND